MAEKFVSPRDHLINLAVIHNGDWNKIHDAIRARENRDDEEVLNNLSYLKCKVVTILDPEYPQALKQIDRPPFVLFYKGDINLISNDSECVAIVGSKDVDKGSLKQAEDMAKAISDSGKVIVAGSAKGVCATALKSAKKCVCVTGSGLDNPYPLENKKLFDEIAKSGLLISEYPPKTQPQAKNFPTRNRIIAGLAKKIVCCKAQKHSGSLVTISFALNYGKDVGVTIPPINDENTVNGELIEQGAFPIASTATALSFVGA